MCADNDLGVPSIEIKCSYRLGDPAKACDMRISDSEKENVLCVSLLQKGDGAFVLRSDNIWRFAIVAQKVLDKTSHIDFILDEKGSKKCLSLKHWASNIRRFQSSSVHEDERQVTIQDILSKLLSSSVSHSNSSTTTASMNDISAATKEKMDQEQEKKNKSSDIQPFLQSERQQSKASPNDETISRDRREYSNHSLYQQVKCEQIKTRMVRRKAVTSMDKTNDEKLKIKYFGRASVKFSPADETRFRSLFEEYMH